MSSLLCDINSTCLRFVQTIQSPCQWAMLIFIIVSTIVHILFLATLIKFRNVEPMNSAFFRILFSFTITALLKVTAQYPFMLTNTTDKHMYVVCVCVEIISKITFDRMDWLIVRTVFLSFNEHHVRCIYAVTFGSSVGLEMHVVTMTLNRFTAIVFPFKHNHVMCRLLFI
jgi:hypothetical protein